MCNYKDNWYMHGLREATETRKNFNKDSGRLLPFCYVDCNT